MQNSSDGSDSMLGIIAGALGIAGVSWQLFQMMRTGQTKAISYNLSILLGISISLWAMYGIEQNDPVIYVPNIILVVLLGGMFAYKKWAESTVYSTPHNI